jgi:hypothetical protein
MKLFENITKEDLEKYSINHLLSNDFNSLEKITDK